MPDLGPAIAVTAARRLRVDGLVQGVGFRPFVHRLALRHQLGGWVQNTSGAVEIHVEGDATAIDRFVNDLRREAPVLARIETLVSEAVEVAGLSSFEVRASTSAADQRLPVSPDVALCASCAREITDPRDRRYRYPFITCTDCGPRFTVIEAMPYDRERTTMRAFVQCPACLREYTTPGDRRHHSETNSCPECGPSLWFERSGDQPMVAHGDHALTDAAHVLRHGGILAVRGLGGFQLAVDATDSRAVRRLRERKHREAKPLAVMVATLDDARRLVELTPGEAELLRSAAAPIVTCRAHRATRLTSNTLAAEVAPGLAHVGVMLAYTPLHQLLLKAAGVPLVMTSGNRSDEPIATGLEEARTRLGGIADAFLMHDREIVARYDDSVLRVVDEEPVFLRRARGYAPLPIDVPIASPRPLLAVGPHMKNTFTLLHGHRAYVSQHIGDLENLETLEHFRAARARFETLFHITPEAVVHDLHPGYLSTRLAIESGLAPVVAVQHHHAHIAAIMAEHGRTDPVIGIAYDGTGYGDDGAIWGSEILYADLAGYRRLAHLRYAPLPGGDAAARAPWRSALGYLRLDGIDSSGMLPGVDEGERVLVERQVTRGINSPPASSMGRLFDAAAAVLGVRARSNYEGQAAMELEALASAQIGPPLPFSITSDGEGWVLDPVPLLVALGARARAGKNVEDLAAAFHDTIVTATMELVRRSLAATGCRTVALGGGCFQNARLLSSLRR
ncbi:MAG TPA: carbamoyltransferase HypF [Gemmatimonadaceae bacterium]|nr:carbamoyltransferase HypF [Gemmatimonadaceae bacterium]